MFSSSEIYAKTGAYNRFCSVAPLFALSLFRDFIILGTALLKYLVFCLNMFKVEEMEVFGIGLRILCPSDKGLLSQRIQEGIFGTLHDIE